ncbi:hypothetical protein ACF1BP_02180 [Streptomyces sp. NPDC014735]|uniref:hypothetical protein n=1 Tax=unclassified Streptomyces TaxID=2593676 RepID=UPI003702D4A5
MAAKPRFRNDTDATPDAAPDSAPAPVADAVAVATGPADRKHPVDETLPPLKLLTSGLQHVAAMYAGVVAPPMIVGPAMGLTAKETAPGSAAASWSPRAAGS